MEWGIDTYAMEIVSTFPYSSWYNLTHRLIDVAFQSRILGISSLELLNNIRLIKVEIHDVNNRYMAVSSVFFFIGKITSSHCESSTEAPTSNESMLFVVWLAEALCSKRFSATASFCFLAFAENRDWIVPTRPAIES